MLACDDVIILEGGCICIGWGSWLAVDHLSIFPAGSVLHFALAWRTIRLSWAIRAIKVSLRCPSKSGRGVRAFNDTSTQQLHNRPPIGFR